MLKQPINSSDSNISWILIIGLFPVLVILVLFTMVNISDVIAPFIMFGKQNLLEIPETSISFSLATVILKLVASFILIGTTFAVHSALLTVFSYIFYQNNVKGLSHKQYSLQDIFLRGIRWNLKRTFKVMKPIIIIISVAIIAFLLALILFNGLLMLASISLGFVTFIITFSGTALIFGFISATIMTIWNLIVTAFGMDIAISEPGLDDDTIINRSRKLAFIKPRNFSLYGIYLLFTLMLFVQFLGIIINPEYIHPEYIISILFVVALDIAIFTGIAYLKSRFYIDSLLYKYKRIITLNPRVANNSL